MHHHTYAQDICYMCLHMPITIQYTSARTKTKYTCPQDQTDMTSHMPWTFCICATCAPRLYHLSLNTTKNTTEPYYYANEEYYRIQTNIYCLFNKIIFIFSRTPTTKNSSHTHTQCKHEKPMKIL